MNKPNLPAKPDETLHKYATNKQWEHYCLALQHGSARAAAKALGVDHSNISRDIRIIKRRAAQHGYAPDQKLVHEIPEGMTSRGPSILLDADGHIKEYWNKMRLSGRPDEETVQLPDPKKIIRSAKHYDAMGLVTNQWVTEAPELQAREELWKAYADELQESLKLHAEVRLPTNPPTVSDSDVCAVYPIGDQHMGMLAWGKENDGQPWDLPIAERTLKGAIDHLMARMPAAETSLIAVLGDFFHYDSIVAETPQSKNKLDTDTRFQKMVRAGVRCMTYAVEQALRKHKLVNVILEFGNHDPYSIAFLMETLRLAYQNEPRVYIDTSPRHYHYFQFGKTLIGTHHGDKAKLQDLPVIMATDVPEMWGQTVHRYIYVGHVHHKQQLNAKYYHGALVETFEVLCPQDAWHSQAGYRSKQSMHAILIDKEDGEISRLTFRPRMLRGTSSTQG